MRRFSGASYLLQVGALLFLVIHAIQFRFGVPSEKEKRFTDACVEDRRCSNERVLKLLLAVATLR